MTSIETFSQCENAIRSAVKISRSFRMRLVMVYADLIGLFFSTVVAHGARWCLGGSFTGDQIYSLWLLPIVLVFFIFCSRGYGVTSLHPAEELRQLTYATTLAFLFLMMESFVFRTSEMYSRSAIFGAWALTLVSIPAFRYVLRSWASRRPWWGVPVVVFGAGITAEVLANSLNRYPSRGLRPVLFLDDNRSKIGGNICGVPVIGPLEEWGHRAVQLGITHALLAMPGAPPERLRQLWRRFGSDFPTVLVVPGLIDFATLWIERKDLGGPLALELTQSLLRPSRLLIKRILDIIIVSVLGALIMPLMLIIALLVKISSTGPMIYGHNRLGLGGRNFKTWKFRTMRSDAEFVLQRLLAENPEMRAEWERDHKLRNDPRVTWIGNILRKTSLDELPQLWNVLCGQMSLVGPRPITSAEIPKYGDQWEVYQRVLPGVTGLWQVSGRNQTTYDERVALDTFYVHNWSPWLDLVILARTVQTVMRGEGAY